MNKEFYIELLEAECERLRDKIENLEDKIHEQDPFAKQLKQAEARMAGQLYGGRPVAPPNLKGMAGNESVILNGDV